MPLSIRYRVSWCISARHSQQTPFRIDSDTDAYYAGRMDWRTLIEELIASGMTEQSIADAVTRMGPRRVTQPTIHRIKNGTEPKHSVGAALIRLHRSRRRTRAPIHGSPPQAQL